MDYDTSKQHWIALDVRTKGLEPPRRETPDPKSGAATNYATCAFASAKLDNLFHPHKRMGNEVNYFLKISDFLKPFHFYTHSVEPLSEDSVDVALSDERFRID